VSAGLPSVPARAQATGIAFAAASSKNALDAVNPQRRQQTGYTAVLISYAASPAPASQIAEGAPGATHEEAAAILAYVRSQKVKTVFEAQGVTVSSQGRS
jgi:hypothetical protein